MGFVTFLLDNYRGLNVDITSELLKDVSPYLASITYHVIKRELELIAVDDPVKMNSKVRVTFPEVTNYSEDIDDLDDDLVDSVIGIHWISSNRICIRTDVREIIISLTAKPYTEIIA